MYATKHTLDNILTIKGESSPSKNVENILQSIFEEMKSTKRKGFAFKKQATIQENISDSFLDTEAVFDYVQANIKNDLYSHAKKTSFLFKLLHLAFDRLPDAALSELLVESEKNKEILEKNARLFEVFMQNLNETHLKRIQLLSKIIDELSLLKG